MEVDEPQKDEQDGSAKKAGAGSLLNCHGRSFEITGLGVVTSLIISFGCLVSDGTLPLEQYLVFLMLMVVSAGAMVWRIWNLVPDAKTLRGEDEDERLKPGEYRIVFK
jgi:hypothetical protein